MISIGAIQCGPDAQAAVRVTAAARAEALARFVAAFEAGKARGEIPIDADSEALARFYTAVIQGMAVQATDGADADRLNALVDAALRAWPGSPQA